MKVFQLISPSGFFGAEKVALDLSRAIKKTTDIQMEVGIIAHGSKGPEKETLEAFKKAGFRPFSIQGQGRINPAGIRQIRSILLENGINIVHSHNYKSDLYAFLSTIGKPEVKIIATCHNWIDTDRKVILYGKIDRKVLKRFNKIIAVSDSVREILIRSGIDERKIRLIENSIFGEDISKFEPDAERPPHAGVAFETSKQPTVGFIGRISSEKGLDDLLEASALLENEKTKFRLKIVGDGPLRERYEVLFRERLRGGTVVEWLGFRRDIPDQLQGMDLFVLPSKIEASPITLLEAMAAGRAIVATTVGDIPKLIRDGENGMLVPPGNPALLMKAMKKVIDHSEFRKRIGARANLDLASHVASVNTFGKYLDIYRELREKDVTMQR